MPSYANCVMLPGLDVDQATERVEAVLSEIGFGILSRIDVHGVMKAKLGVDHRPYRILGACNPGLAHRALDTEPHVGLLMPCNVLVQEVDGGAEVGFLAARAQLSVAGNDALDALAAEADALLGKAAAALANA